jgi:hypothetical protein
MLLGQRALELVDVTNVFFVRFAGYIEQAVAIRLGTRITQCCRPTLDEPTLTAYTRAFTAPIPPYSMVR